MKKQNGFTLVELVIVIAVLGILAGLAIPYFMEAREEAAKKECLANRTQILRMFHAQQAQGYSGDLTAFLAEVTKEENNENKYFTFIPKCADNGKYYAATTYSGNGVVCDVHVGDSSVMASINSMYEKMLNSIKNSDGSINNEALKELFGKDFSGILGKNDYLREAFNKYLAENGYNVWIEGKGVNGDDTVYFKFHSYDNGQGLLVYANANGKFQNSGDWTANYVYNPNDSKWYYFEKGVYVSNIENLNAAEAWKKIIQQGKGYEEVSLNGNNFVKA